MHDDIVNTGSALWRTVRRAYGRPFNQPLYFETSRLAARQFNRSVSFKCLYRDFLGTYRSFVRNSGSMGETEWCSTLVSLLKTEAKTNGGMRYYEDPEAVRNTGHYQLDLSKWFSEPKTDRERVLQRLAMLEAAKQCGISPVKLFLDCGLIEISVLGMPM